MARKNDLVIVAFWIFFILFSISLMPSPLVASEYPTKPIQFIIPYTPGGITDVLGRLTCSKSAEFMGQPMVVVNKPGAGGVLGADFVANSKPDGYTLSNGNIATHAINPAISSRVPYDPVKSFTPICNLIDNQNVILVRADSPLSTLEKMIDFAKKNPGKLVYGSSGVGTSNHLTAELLQQASGIQMAHVPHKGASPSLMALLGGHIEMVVSNYIDAIEQVKAGKVIALAVTSPQRFRDMPQVPSVVELGYPSVVMTPWHGVVGPAGLPKAIVDKLSGYFQKVLSTPDVKDKIYELGMTLSFKGPDDFKKWIQSEVEKYRTLAKKANIKLD
jgi:tripartite-type tricarboxylate transporter receptor subunit TctC